MLSQRNDEMNLTIDGMNKKIAKTKSDLETQKYLGPSPKLPKYVAPTPNTNPALERRMSKLKEALDIS